MIRSMTAYARSEAKGEWGSAAWELRSVNQRYLETYIRLPEQLRSLEPVLRERFRAKLQRGKVECNLRFEAAQAAASQVYEQAGIGPEDIRVVELHDCFAHNELLTYEALGLCPIGEAERFILDGDNTYGGRVVTNPSGGLLSKGHPLGATGLAQCYELTHQLRGTADKRQVEGVNLALQHNLGLGGACVVTLYGRA